MVEPRGCKNSLSSPHFPWIGFSIGLLMLAASLGPLASAETIDFEAIGAPLSDNPEDAPITYA